MSSIKCFVFYLFLISFFTSYPLFSQEPCGENYACHEALIRFAPQASPVEREKVLSHVGASVLSIEPVSGIYHVKLPESQDTLGQISEISGEKNVLLSSPNQKIRASSLPNDPYMPYLWALKNTGDFLGLPGVDLNIERAWSYGTDCSSVTVAVIDTGVDYDHPDLKDNIWTNTGEIPDNGIDDDHNGYIDDIHGYDFANGDGDPMDDHYHGTHVAGTIGAVGNNGIGVAGVCWKAKIMAVKFMDSNGSGWYSDAIQAIGYAVQNGAKVLNNSWGGGYNDPGISAAITAADNAGVIFVAAAGNSAVDTDVSPMYPAAYTNANIISVAAMTADNTLAYFSNYGANSVDLGAPGHYIFSTLPRSYYAGDDDYAFLSGTSMASPQVAGAAALIWSQNPSLTHRQVIQTLLQGVKLNSDLSGRSTTGGELDVTHSLFLANTNLNHIPQASVGGTQTVSVNTLVQLSGSGTDSDGDALSYRWSLSKPSLSQSALSNLYIQNPTFSPDRAGTYVASLVVSDAWNDSVLASTTITVTDENVEAPVALILYRQSNTENSNLTQNQIEVDKAVSLDATSSEDHLGDGLSYEWSLLTKPAGSEAQLSNSHESVVSIMPDVEGTYTLRLTVNDSQHESSQELSLVAVALDSSGGSQITSPGAGKSGCSLNMNSSNQLSQVMIYMFLICLLRFFKQTILVPKK